MTTATPTTTSFLTTRRRVTVLLFTFAAGSVDAISYLRGHVFTANMTGNSVLLAIDIGEGRGPAAANSVIALIAFILGVLLGAFLAGEAGDKAKTFTAVRREVFFEGAVLAVFAASCLVPPSSSFGSVIIIIATSGVAMGMQSAAVKRLSLPGVATTYITGTITSLFSGIVHNWRTRELRAARQAAAAASGNPAQHASHAISVRHALGLQAQVFFSYTIAALVSAVLHFRWPGLGAVLPVLAIFGIGVYMLFARPAARITQVSQQKDLSA